MHFFKFIPSNYNKNSPGKKSITAPPLDFALGLCFYGELVEPQAVLYAVIDPAPIHKGWV